MTKKTDLTYAALITITLPGKGESVSMTVTLSPGDMVTAGGQTKPLGDCTLADLRRYAAELEKDVWETYQQIALPELDADSEVEVLVSFPDKELEMGMDWSKQMLVLPPAEAVEAAAREDEGVEDETGPQTVLEAEGSPDVEEQPVDGSDAAEAEPQSTPALEAEDVDLHGVAVAEAELVFPEIEVEVSGEAIEAEPAVEQPGVIPSQARVRVAGERLPLGNPTWAAVDILMDEPALRAAQAHALSSLNREVAGVLVGRRPEKQPDGRYLVHIFDTIVAKHTVMQGASVTYTPESWRYLNDTLNERYPDETAVMVGWYHTHPGFGIFLSGMDLFIHQNFFTQVWHVAMVLDPQARTSGFFCWDRPKSRVSRYDFPWPSWAAGSW
jgi:proteasome lid subunit RPN8/RPN11